MTSGRKRLDVHLVDTGLAPTRTRATELIRAGKVRVGGHVLDKPGMSIRSDADVQVEAVAQFVGRGGYKLAAALDEFGVDPSGRTCLDVGAATGGFTDALLQRGASRVLAVDVGRAQLAWSLRTDPRVVNLERTDIRSLSSLADEVALVTVDVAFIGLDRVLPAVHDLVRTGVRCIALVKPQFEAGRKSVGSGGVVRDPAVHREVLAKVIWWCVTNGWRPLDAITSPLTGADGNREFFLLLEKGLPAPDDPGVEHLITWALAAEPIVGRHGSLPNRVPGA
jgi:23S rRNA (cytidine1920-2'-O)/16S rRNA (cytidine1409-2'-O)-methyltransferase